MAEEVAPDTEPWPCWFHGVEPIPSNVYRRCFECGHVWTKRTLKRKYRQELLRRTSFDPVGDHMHRLWLWWRALTVRASTIFFCQECIHDF